MVFLLNIWCSFQRKVRCKLEHNIILLTEPLSFPEDYHSNGVRRRRSEEKDSLALSKEIFKNITKHLRENIKREGATDRSDHLLQSEYRSSYVDGSFVCVRYS